MVQTAEMEYGPGAGSDAQLEQRRANRLLFYWQALRRIEGVPVYVDFDPRRNPLPWNQCFVLFRETDGRLVFDAFGTELLALIGGLPASIDQIPEYCVLDELLEGLPFVFSRGQPWKYDGETDTPLGEIRHRSVLLPFRDVHRREAYVLGGVTFRIFPAAGAAR
ncbi:MAG: PAS domain-containing protein [Alphaproteobacteria bacterium]